MKKLLIHIGYPKTGTTTLQEEVFVKLHELGEINFLGRTVKSSHTRTGKSAFNGVDWVRQIRKNFILDEPLKDDHQVLKPDMLNVISDEDLTFHGLYHHAQFGKFVDHFEFPDKLKNILGENVEVELMVTLRNQADLLFSSYVQKFRFVKSSFGEYSFDDFLNNSTHYLGRDIKDHLSLYDFDLNINLWEKTFHAKSRILFFEDFVHDKDLFFTELFEILQLPEMAFSNFNLDKHYRKKDKSKDSIKSGYWTLSSMGMIGKKLFKKDLDKILEKRYHMRSSFYLNFEKKMLMKFNSVEIPNLSNVQKIMIKDYFAKSNREFAKNRGIDLYKMEKYAYL